MEQNEGNSKKDFSIIFKEIEKFHLENPSFSDIGISDEDLRNDESIREFTEICRQINDLEADPTICLTFS
jgi:hypothetical protein